jgi:allophanate hydrolase
VQELPSLDLTSLQAAYASGRLKPSDLVDRIAAALDARSGPGVWIHKVPAAELRAAALALEARKSAGQPMPLYGIPFAVKDNIDVAGLPTTAACPAYARPAAATAPVVKRLLDAGALLVGKTNLDQFATGLVGVRSPYGVPPNPFDPRYIVGGSSSGSAAAVARGVVSFALGTDTAGSGRVPAGFTNLVGLKPSPGLLSTRGVVPACRSLDCVSVFALTCEDAAAVTAVAAAHDPQDPYSRPAPSSLRWEDPIDAPSLRFGVPAAAHLDFFGDRQQAVSFEKAMSRLRQMGVLLHEVDLGQFFEAAELLYDGPWIAERLAGLEEFVEKNPEALLPVTRGILLEGKKVSGTQAFAGQQRLAALKQSVRPLWNRIDVLVVPTAPGIYRIEDVEREPRSLNKRLGRYTNFVNLLDLAALAVPSGLRDDGLPAGITFIGPWGSDGRLAALGSQYHRRVGGTMGATGAPLTVARAARPPESGDGLRLAVVGAHLGGEPLNHQLTERGAHLVRACKTAPLYRLYALPGTTPPKPGLVRIARDGIEGTAIDVEVWEMPRPAFGSFFALVPPPLCLGTIELEDGEKVSGFLCESYAVKGAEDISSFGGWRAFKRQARVR